MLIILVVTLPSTASVSLVHDYHEFSSEWSFDELGHWHKAICAVDMDCAFSMADAAAHSIADGKCTVCGYVAESNDTDDDENLDNGNAGEGSGSSDNVGGEDNGNTGEGGNDGSDSSGDNDKPDDIPDEPSVCVHQYSCEQIKAPSCTEAGENIFTCTLCMDNYTESVEPTGHSEVTVHGKLPTCTEAGFSSGKRCEVCGEITKQQIEISPTGHSFSDESCVICGEINPDYVAPDPYLIQTETTNTYCWVDLVSFTAGESGEYTFILPEGLGAWDADACESGKPGPVINSLHPNYVAGEFSFSVKIAAGMTYEFYIAAVIKAEWEIRWSFTACEVEIEDEIEQISELPLLIGANAINGESVFYWYKATDDGELSLSVGSALLGEVTITYSVNGGEEIALGLESETLITLSDGDELVISVVADGYSSISASWTVYSEPEIPEHQHNFVNGECECGEKDPDYVPEEIIDITGIYIGTDAFGNQLLDVIIDSEAGTVVFDYYHPLTGPNVVNATYVITNGVVILYNQDGAPLHPLAGTLTLEDNIPVMASFNGTEYSLSLGDPDDNEGEEDEEIKVIKGIMVDGEENSFTVTDEDISIDKMYVTFIPVNDGVYDFLSEHIFVVAITKEDGTPADMNMYENYVLQSYQKYVLEISLEYISRAGEYTITPKYEYPKGHPKNPYWYIYDEENFATYKGDYKPVWYQIYANVTGKMIVSTNVKGVTVMLAAVSDFDLAATETLTLDVVQGRKYYIGLAAYDRTDEVRIKFNVKIEEGPIKTDGGVNTPHNVILGENTTELGAQEGIYYVYQSTANGTLTLSPESVGFSWSFADFIEPVNMSDDEISIHLLVGEVVYLYVEADANISEPVSFNASFKDDPTQISAEGPLVIDGSSPNEIVFPDNTFTIIRITGTVGSFKLVWDNEDAIVTFDGVEIENGSVIEINSPWFAPYIQIYLDGYAAGVVNLTVTKI